MQLLLEVDTRLLDRLTQGYLVGMGVSGMDWGTSVTGLRSGRNNSIGILFIKCTGAIRVQKV